jgi:hypothetical protein
MWMWTLQLRLVDCDDNGEEKKKNRRKMNTHVVIFMLSIHPSVVYPSTKL